MGGKRRQKCLGKTFLTVKLWKDAISIKNVILYYFLILITLHLEDLKYCCDGDYDIEADRKSIFHLEGSSKTIKMQK